MAYYDEKLLLDQLRKVADTARQELRDADIGGSMTLEIEITGEIQRGGLRVQFKADCLRAPGLGVYANSFGAAVKEMMRRMGFEREHAPLMLEAPEPPAAAATDGPRAVVDDDMPF